MDQRSKLLPETTTLKYRENTENIGMRNDFFCMKTARAKFDE